MKKRILIIYYSRTGKNKKIAQELARKLSCNLEEIIDTAKRDGLWGYFLSGMQATLKMKARIKPVKNDPGKYDTVVIIAPLWISVLPPAVRTYLSENREKIKNAVLVSVCGSGSTVNIMAIPDFESLIGKKALASLILSEKEYEGNYENKLNNFLKEILLKT